MSEEYVHGGYVASLDTLRFTRFEVRSSTIFCDDFEMTGFTGLAEGESRPGLPRWESSDYNHA